MNSPPDLAQPWNSPVGPRALAHALGLLDLGADEALLDVGCGNGEVLARALQHHPGPAVGVDPDLEALGRARHRLMFAADRLRLHAGPVAEASLGPGSFGAALCIGSDHAFGTGGEALPAALDALFGLLRPGGLLVLGAGFWRRPPPPDYLLATGLVEDELRSHEDNLQAAEERGFEPIFVTRSTDQQWDLFESAFWARVEREARLAPDDLAARQRWARVRRWRDAYLQWGCTTMGFGLYVLRRG